MENSIEAFQHAKALGADGVELDVHGTADGHFLVHHDPDLPGLGHIAELTAAVASTYHLPNGEPIPDLAQAIGVLGGMEVWVEVKTLSAPLDGAFLDLLTQGEARGARIAVHSFDHRIIARLEARAPALRTGLLSASYPVDPWKIFEGFRARTLWQEATLIDSALVSEARDRGIDVIAWTVNTVEEARRLAVCGVRALCGNFPDRLREALERPAEGGA